jgi:dUTPase
MKTIKIVSRDKTLPPPWSNPFSVFAADAVTVLAGKQSYVSTGLTIEMPDGVSLKVEQAMKEIVPIGCFFIDNKLFVTVIIACEKDCMIVETGQHIANIWVIKSESESIRFIDFSEGKRMLVGDGQAGSDAKNVAPTSTDSEEVSEEK